MLTKPAFLDTYKKTKNQMTRSLKERKMKSSFKLKDDVIKFIQDLKWSWKMPWRDEQREVIETFLNLEYDEIVIQAIFGGGKTTIMLAIIYMLVLNDFELIDKIFICAFNLGEIEASIPLDFEVIELYPGNQETNIKSIAANSFKVYKVKK